MKVLELATAESAIDLDVGDAIVDGARAIKVGAPVLLSADEPRPTLALIRLLRDAASVGIPVAWNGGVGAGVDARLLIHLSPPGPLADEDTSVTVATWRHHYQPGRCYYRMGPGFVFIKDVRWEAESAARFRLERDDVEDVFQSLEKVVDVPTLDASTSEVLDDLAGEHLVLQLDDLATLLPYRMRRWPVPALEV